MRTTATLVALALTACAAGETHDYATLDAGSDAAQDGAAAAPPPLDASWALGEGTRSGVVSCWCQCADGDGTSARECRGAEAATLDAFGDEWAAAAEDAKGGAGACWCRCLDVPAELLPAEPSAYPACSADVGPRAHQ